MPLGETLTGGHTGSSRFGPVRVLLILAQLVTAAGFFIALGGLAKLQKTANGLGITANSATATLYSGVFAFAGVPPYPTNPHYQFALFWWLLFLELCVLVWIVIICMVPAMVLRMKSSAAYVLIYCWVLFSLGVQSLIYFHKSATARTVFGARAINTTMAGVLIVLVCNGITLIMLGLIGTGREYIAPAATHGHSVGGKKVGPDVAHEPTAQQTI